MKSTYTLGRGRFKTIQEGNELSWMIGNGIGGYSSSTAIGGGATSFHGYLVASLNPPVMRTLVFTRTNEEVIIGSRKYDLASQMYVNYSKNGHEFLERFVFDEVPTYIYRVEDVNIKKTICVEYGKNTATVCYEIQNGSSDINFSIIPLFNYKRPEDLKDKSQIKFTTSIKNNYLKLIPNENKDISINFYTSEGEYYDRSLIPVSMATPNYLIDEDEFYMIDNRTGTLGLDNHYTPYEVQIKIKANEHKKFYVKCSIDEIDSKTGFEIVKEYKNRINSIVDNAGYNNNFVNNLIKAADHFIVNRNSTKLKTILAGFPWFTDWGRDTMIAFEGLCLTTKRFNDAREILESFAKYIKNGLVPNVFPDINTEPMYNTVDASLWYFQAVYKYLKYTGTNKDYDFIKNKIYNKLLDIYENYKKGTDFSIKMDVDGLIEAGDGLDQVTWMDVRVGDLVVTPRHGKPVEINALWYNALCILIELTEKLFKNEKSQLINELIDLKEKVKESFNKKFWYEEGQYLYDVVDENDPKIRPNQIFAVSLPFSILPKDKKKKVVETVYKHLYSTYGLRSLSFLDENYKNKYIGKLIDRDKAYHMGTTWAYLIGPFITAFVKVNEYSKKSIFQAKEMLELFEDHLNDGCINGIAEIFDGDFPSTGRGCYSQAWSVAEVLRAFTQDVMPYL